MLLAARAAGAADTQWWTSNQAADFARAEARGVTVGANGSVRLGPRADSWRADSLGVVWAVLPLRDGSVAMAGDGGRIDRWTENEGVRRWIQLPVGQVLALAPDGDGLVAGTGPGGAIYHVGSRGDTALLARTGERYVWALAAGPKHSWYAATGTRGRLFAIESGKPRIVLDTDESNLVSILADGHGGVYAGGDSKGRVFHVDAEGKASAVFDASEDEVRGLAFGPDGALYAAALSTSAVTAGSGGVTVNAAAGSAAGAAGGDDDGDRAAPATTAIPGGRAVIYRIVPDSSVTPWWTSPQPALFALAGDANGVLAASGNRAAVYRVTDASAASVLLMAPQGQVTALALSKGTVFAATSNPAVLWRLGPATAERGELISPAFDAHRLSRFGRLVWHGLGGHVTLLSRSGNVEPPDTTWTRWSGGENGPEGEKIAAPASRYLQWKLVLGRADQEVESVEASWREINQPPRVDGIVIAPQGQGFREGELQPRTEPVTQSLPGGQKVEYSVNAAASARGLRALPAWAHGLRTVQWKASDANGDVLRYKVERRAEGATDWIKIVDDLEVPVLTWDTNSLPDGRYRLRVTATDAISNAVGEERVTSEESLPFDIDNTPPRVGALTANPEPGAAKIEGEAADEGGRLWQLDVAVDEGDWRSLAPDGGLTDGPRATFHARLAGLSAGEHTISVRATDLAGNVATRAVRVTVPRAR
jgi:hypothetical protein